jgi:DNA-binding XRE family transcriptional regulator
MARQRNRHIGTSLDDWLKDESAKDASFAAGLDEQFDKYRLAQKLKAMRQGAGLSQEELAERVRTKQPSVARIDRLWAYVPAPAICFKAIHPFQRRK